MTPSSLSTAVASAMSFSSEARLCSPSTWNRRTLRPPVRSSSSAGETRRLSHFQVLRAEAGMPCFAQLASKRSITCGFGQSKMSMPSAISPGCSAFASAMKKRPSKVPISAIGPVTPRRAWMPMIPADMAAANRDDMPGTVV